jgi:hypothetical protein
MKHIKKVKKVILEKEEVSTDAKITIDIKDIKKRSECIPLI